MTRHVVALGGGGFGDDRDGALDDFVLNLVASDEPRVCFVPTASGDAEAYVEQFLHAAGGRARCRVLRLFDRDVADLGAFLTDQDVVYVGGGNTVSMLAVWRAHGLDVALRRAYEAGVVMAGVSAGANCWFGRCTTDSWLQGRADPLLDGLGWLPGGMCPHYRSEPRRRPGLLGLVADGFGDTWAVDDGCALHFVDEQLSEVVASRPGAQAFLVRRGAEGEVVEEKVSTIGSATAGPRPDGGGRSG